MADLYYTEMKTMIERSRKGLLNEEVQQPASPGVIGDKSQELQNRVMPSDSEGFKITLDFNKQASVVTDGQQLSESITAGLQQILNSYLEATNNFVTSTENITVHIGSTAVVITVKVILDDNQPATVTVNSETQKIQMKYDNFLQLSEKNVSLMAEVFKYFNHKLMTQLQGLVTAR